MVPAADPSPERLKEAASRLAGRPVDDVQPVGGGRNSRVYKVRAGNENFALKQYPPPDDADPRRRLMTETDALAFLRRNGLTCVPGVVDRDPEAGFALFEWIEGKAVETPDEGQVDQALAFLAAVHTLSALEGARDLPPASEACLSGAEVVRQVRTRFDALAGTGEKDLAAFLEDEAEPALAETVSWAEREYADQGMDFTADIEAAWQSLIPADFGFHNALRRHDGELVFLDFDYFGWDDPARLTADVLLHPAGALSEPLKSRFAAGMAGSFRMDEIFSKRLRLLYPLCGLRWVAILLNEFLPERWARRQDAGTETGWDEAKAEQMAKAKALLNSIRDSQGDFPYGA